MPGTIAVTGWLMILPSLCSCHNGHGGHQSATSLGVLGHAVLKLMAVQLTA
jgi:hypothetical protein